MICERVEMSLPSETGTILVAIQDTCLSIDKDYMLH
jgi:hypothetical protein